MTSSPDNLFEPSCTTIFVIETDKITLRTKWTQNLLMIFDIVSVYFAVLVTIGLWIKLATLLVVIYFAVGLLLIITYRRTIVIDKGDNTITLLKIWFMSFKNVFIFHDISDIIIIKKKRQISGNRLYRYDYFYLYFQLHSGKKIFIDRSNNNDFMLQRRQQILNFMRPTSESNQS